MRELSHISEVFRLQHWLTTKECDTFNAGFLMRTLNHLAHFADGDEQARFYGKHVRIATAGAPA